jgi:hypothetical protein
MTRRSFVAMLGIGALWGGCGGPENGRVPRPTQQMNEPTQIWTATPIPASTPTPPTAADLARLSAEISLSQIDPVVTAWIRDHGWMDELTDERVVALSFLARANAMQALLEGPFLETKPQLDPQIYSREIVGAVRLTPDLQIRMLEQNDYRVFPPESFTRFIAVVTSAPQLDRLPSSGLIDLIRTIAETIQGAFGEITKQSYILVQMDDFRGGISHAGQNRIILNTNDRSDGLVYLIAHEFCHSIQRVNLGTWFLEGSADLMARYVTRQMGSRFVGTYAGAADGQKVLPVLSEPRRYEGNGYFTQGGNGFRFLAEVEDLLGMATLGPYLGRVFARGSSMEEFLRGLRGLATGPSGGLLEEVIVRWT